MSVEGDGEDPWITHDFNHKWGEVDSCSFCVEERADEKAKFSQDPCPGCGSRSLVASGDLFGCFACDSVWSADQVKLASGPQGGSC